MGHPVVGDEFYGMLGELKPDRERPATGVAPRNPMSPYIGRQALHALELSFAHPMTGEWQAFTAPLPDDFENAIELVRAL
jgi:23S rRNA pseudouridine1911/1915/1917 synthase